MRLQARLLIAIIPVIVVSLLSLKWIVFVQLQNHTQMQLTRQMNGVLAQTEQQSLSFIDTTLANARLFANSRLLQRFLLVEHDAERAELLKPALYELFASYQEAFPQYQELRLLSPEGDEIVRFASKDPVEHATDASRQELFEALHNNRSPAFSVIGSHPDTGAPTLSMGRALRLLDDGPSPLVTEISARGYLMLTASLDALRSYVVEQLIGEQGYLIVMDRQGSILFHRNPHLEGSSYPGLVQQLGADRLDADTERPLSRVEFRGRPYIARWRPLHDNLLVLAMVPEADVATTSQQLARSIAGIAFLVILLTTISYYLLIRSTILRPIMRLIQTAIAIGEGQLDTRIDVRRDDEIGDLAQALSDMKHKLGASMNELKLSHARIEQLAYRDALTDLPNRRLFIRQVEQAISMESRKNGKLAILFLDLDDFKRVNDTLGHEAGDFLLQEVAVRLQHCIRESDELTLVHEQGLDKPRNQVARIGGDEFILLLTALGHPDHATIVARRIIAELARPVIIDDRSFIVGTSIGISMYPADADNVEGLIKCADTAMYDAKRKQKNTFRYYGETMQTNIEMRLQLEDDLRLALKQQQFELYYQPQFDTRTGQLAGAEALLRWNHPDRGMIPPDQFIPVAEDTGMIGTLGDWVLQQACQHWRFWSDQEIAPLRIAVNVSQRQFALCDLLQSVTHALESNQMPAHALELELTESCMMEGPSLVVDTLQRLRQIGVRIAMDDFGTGYSSLGALTSLPIDTLKIDRSFVNGIESDTQNSNVVSAILMLARSLGLEIVAEGVEVQAELDYLSERDCDVVQGYLLGRPLCLSSMSELLLTLHENRQERTG